MMIRGLDEVILIKCLARKFSVNVMCFCEYCYDSNLLLSKLYFLYSVLFKMYIRLEKRFFIIEKKPMTLG